ncbi:MAG: MFS transporter [Patulibacter sp.]|nr:MFS transporter [Patulibacter sp.]
MTSITSPAAAAATTDRARRDAVLLIAVLLACVTVPTAVSGSGVALPAIAADTHAGVTSLQWVVNAFNLAFAASTLLAGSLADLFGRQRGFAVGVGLFLAASVLSAVAGDILVLDVARALAGVGAAAIFACGSALLSVRFTGAAQGRAFALLGTAAGIGLGIGPTIAGVLVDAFGWQAFFAVGAITGTIVLALAWWSAGDEPHLRTDATIDRPGSLSFVLGLLLLIVAIVQASQWGWGSPQTLLVAAAAVALLATFARVERRAAHPLLDLALLRDRQLVGLILVPVVAAIGFVTLLTYLPTYMSVVWRDSTATAGVQMLLMTVPVFLAPVAAGAAVARGATPRQVIVVSLVLLVAGPALLLLLGPGASVWVAAPGMVSIGAGFGLGVGLVDGQAIGRVHASRSGMAAGLVNTSRLGSEAIAVAAYGSLLASLIASRITADVHAVLGRGADVSAIAGDVATGRLDAAAGAADPAALQQTLRLAYDHSLHVVLAVLIVAALLLAAITTWLLRPGPAIPAVGIDSADPDEATAPLEGLAAGEAAATAANTTHTTPTTTTDPAAHERAAATAESRTR